jgi:putative flippase GtrA
MALVIGDRQTVVPRFHRPAVVEHVDSPQSTSDGRATNRPSFAIPQRVLRSQLARFAVIGILCTLAWAGLYALLRGAGLGSVAANGLALLTTAVANTAANRRLTFGVTGRHGLVRHHGAGLLAFGLAIGLTTAAATALRLAVPGAGRLVEIAVLSGANVVATVGRFVLLRTWVGRASPRAT